QAATGVATCAVLGAAAAAGATRLATLVSRVSRAGWTLVCAAGGNTVLSTAGFCAVFRPCATELPATAAAMPMLRVPTPRMPSHVLLMFIVNPLLLSSLRTVTRRRESLR